MMMRITIIVLLFFMAGQSFAIDNINYFFRHLTVEDGLAHTDVTSVIQGKQGFMWIGSTAGLQRFDGKNLELFWNSQSHVKAVYNNRIRSLAVDHMGGLWIGTEGGLKHFNTEINQFDLIQPMGMEDEEILSKDVFNVMVLNDQEVYFICETGVYHFIFEGMMVKEYVCLYSKDFSANYLGRFLVDDGNFWVAASDELIYIPKDRTHERNGGFQVKVFDQDNEQLSGFYTVQKSPSNEILVGSDNRLLAISGDQFPTDINPTVKASIYYIPEKVYQINNTTSKGKIIPITEILIDEKSNYWLASLEGLLFARRNHKTFDFSLYNSSQFDKNSLTANYISNLYIDRSNNLWVSTYSGGVNYINLDQKQFSILRTDPTRTENTLVQNFVRAIAEDKNGNIWLGTRSMGVNKYDPKTNTYQHFSATKKNQLISDNIRSMVCDMQGRIWIGSDRGINIYENNMFRTIQGTFDGSPGQLKGNTFFSMAVDFKGRIWAGSWDNQGINIIDYKGDGKYTIQTLTQDRNNLCSNRISFIYTDNQRKEVFVSTNKGLNHIILNNDGSIETVYKYVGYENDSTSLSSNYIWPLVRMNDSILWAGTLGGGLNKVKILGNGRYDAQHFGPQEGAPSSDIESLLIDANDNLWLGTRGLSVFDTKTNSFTNYEHDDGLQGNSFKISSALKTTNGMMYFGGVKGVTFFHPDSIKKNTEYPEISFTDLFVHNKKIKPGEPLGNEIILSKNINLTRELDLSYKHNDFSISFASLQFDNPEKIRFKYIMEGLNTSWITTQPGERTVSYANLDYGTYTFKVIGSNSDGVWSGRPKELIINVNPPFWNTQIAQTIYAFLVVLIIGGAFYIQRRWYKLKKDLEITILEEQKMEDMHQMRLKFFTNISHEFRTPLTLILSPIQRLIAGEAAEGEKNRLHKIIFNNAQRLLSLINELMDFRKVETDYFDLKLSKGDIGSTTQDIVKGFDEMADQKKLRLDVQVKDKLPQIWYDHRIVEKIILNLVSNAFRYTNEGYVTVYVGIVSYPEHIESDLDNTYFVKSQDRSEQYVYIKIKDSGIGITKASIQNIFDRYYRISDSESKHLGSGVGLALVKSLVMKHKGDIYVHSERRVGSEFIVFLPIGKSVYKEEEFVLSDENVVVDEVVKNAIQSPTHEQEVSAEEFQEGLPTILLVEDNTELLAFLRDCFVSDYNVVDAKNGEEGLARVHEHNPDIIISDIMMPVMDGLRLCEVLKEDVNTSHIPFILLTAKSGEESRITGTDLGADAYFSKPFNLVLLQKTVHNILESRKKLKERYMNDTFLEEREMVNNKRDRDFMDQLIEIINKKIDDPAFDIDHLCMEVGNSRTKLYNKIKGLTGLSVGEFIRRLRMKKSAEILLREDISVSEVMMRVGIQSQSHFTKTFKKEFGVTPAQYSKSTIT